MIFGTHRMMPQQPQHSEGCIKALSGHGGFEITKQSDAEIVDSTGCKRPRFGTQQVVEFRLLRKIVR